jgi:hypothetical protein
MRPGTTVGSLWLGINRDTEAEAEVGVCWSARERDEMLPPTTTFPSDDSGIASTGPTATVPREFVCFADAVDAKPPSRAAFWSSYTPGASGSFYSHILSRSSYSCVRRLSD